MQFTAILTLALATVASASAVPASAKAERDFGFNIGGNIISSLGGAISAKCRCPPDNTGGSGVHINSGTGSYQCAYPQGACTWSDVSFALWPLCSCAHRPQLGALQNTAQTNCPKLAICIPL
jgi:hypothetical protein